MISAVKTLAQSLEDILETDSNFLEQLMLIITRIIATDVTSAHHVQTSGLALEGLRLRKAWVKHWVSLMSPEARSLGCVFLPTPSSGL